MKTIKKLSLIIIGLILSLIFLEIGLQLTGFTLITIKKYKNKTTKDPNIITILCLGESTTDGQWPPILQEILDKKSKNKKFNVIDEGMPGIPTIEIAKNLKTKLLKYQPDCIISMTGINTYILLGYREYKIKLFNLIQAIFFHFIIHHFYTDVSFSETDTECKNLIKNNKILLAQKKYYYLLKRSNFIDIYTYCRLWELIENLEKVDIAFYDNLLKHDKIFIMDLALKYILNYLVVYKKYNMSQIKNFLIENKNRILFYYNHHEQNIELLEHYGCSFVMDIELEAGAENNMNISKAMIINLLDIKNKAKNYLYIIKEAYNFNNNIFFIPMQYPNLSIKELKQDLKDSPYYDKLIFISNEENFKKALETHKTEEIFKDMFAGSFGHCTELGNTLCGRNYFEII